MATKRDVTVAPPSGTLADHVFPSGEPRDGHLLRADLVASWESQLIGLGRTTAFLTPLLLRRRAAPDDMGLNLIFLQRHRVEVGLKLLLERAGGPPLNTHKISLLFDATRRRCEAAGFASAFGAFAARQHEFIFLMHRIDPGAATFRYPVDRDDRPWQRDDLVDVEELEGAGRRFEDEVLQMIAALLVLELPPVAVADAEATVSELDALSAACRGMVESNREAMRLLQEQADRLGAGRRVRQRRDEADVFAGSEDVEELTLALATRVERMRDHLATSYGLDRPVLSTEPPPDRPPFPQVTPTFDLTALNAQQDAQIKWIAREMVRAMRPVGLALHPVLRRTAQWETPAARQVRLDAARFSSRFMRGVTEEALQASESGGWS